MIMNGCLIALKDSCCASEDQNVGPRLAGDNYLTRPNIIICLFSISLSTFVDANISAPASFLGSLRK